MRSWTARLAHATRRLRGHAGGLRASHHDRPLRLSLDSSFLESHRGRALGQWLMAAILEHPVLQGLRRWMLATHDAHGLYRKVGFTGLAHPERFMELVFTGLYEGEAEAPKTASP